MTDISKLVLEARGVRNVPFHEIVEATSGHKVIQIDNTSAEDLALVDGVAKSANAYLQRVKRIGQVYKGKDPRNISRPLEVEFVEQMGKLGLQVKHLGGSGYPDHRMVYAGSKVCFFETKVTTQIEKGSARSFYYTNAKKIDGDGHHLLIGWEIEEESPGHFVPTHWRLVDLYDLKVGLKAEFNANNLGIYKKALELRRGP